MTTEDDRDRLEMLLDASAPEVPEPSATVRAGAMSMIAAAENGDDARPRPRRHRLSRAVIAGIASGSLLGLGGIAAAAATFEQWSPWAQNPDAGIGFTLPSGAECEYRVGGFEKMGAEAAAVVRAYVARVDLDDVVDIDGALRQLREQEYVAVQDDGTEVVGGYGTDHYFSPDKEFHMAVTWAVGEAIDAELLRQGVDGDVDYMGEAVCPGYQW
jgi:hypothetical protein